jgi:hypothetical protein
MYLWLGGQNRVQSNHRDSDLSGNLTENRREWRAELAAPTAGPFRECDCPRHHNNCSRPRITKEVPFTRAAAHAKVWLLQEQVGSFDRLAFAAPHLLPQIPTRQSGSG